MEAMRELLKELGLFSKAASDCEAVADVAGAEAMQHGETDLAAVILALETAVARVENVRRTFNRNLTPIRFAMAKKMISEGEEVKDIYGHRFRVSSSGHYSPPPRTKDPVRYMECVKWLKENGATVADVSDPIEESNPPCIVVDGHEWRINSAGLKSFCLARLERGESLGPYVGEHNDISIKTRKL